MRQLPSFRRSLSNPARFICLTQVIAIALVIGASWRIVGLAQVGLAQNAAPQKANVKTAVALADIEAAKSERPKYNINATIDYDLLTFKSEANITVPVAANDAMRDVVFFLFANADGVGGDDARHKNIVVDGVSMEGAKVPFKLDGAVLRVSPAQAMTRAFTLKVDYHGAVPRSAPGSGGLADMMGGMGSDLGDLLGGVSSAPTEAKANQAQATEAKPKNTDYGLYTYGNGILSLGSFWYPSLAVRRDGKWSDAAPQGLGDVAYSEMSDFDVFLTVPKNVVVTAPGIDMRGLMDVTDPERHRWFRADNVRDFAVLMSEDFQKASKDFKVGDKTVKVEALTTKKHAVKAAQAIDVAGHALQIYSKRFGSYPYASFKIVEGPMRGGAGGMEYSGMTAIASMLYDDWGKQIEALSTTPGAGDLSKILGEDADMSTHVEEETPKSADETASNPGSDFLRDTLGNQKAMLDTIFETTVAHEVAHQWWAIGVGSDSQRSPFVDESLTNYCAMLYFEDRYGRERAAQMMDIHLRTSYSMTRTLGQADAPANMATASYKNNLQYGAIVYGKGALYYDALRREVGDAVFFASLREYYARYHDRLAEPRDLLRIVQQKAPAKSSAVGALFARWIEQAHGDDDITGGKPASINDLLGGMLGGGLPGAAGDE